MRSMDLAIRPTTISDDGQGDKALDGQDGCAEIARASAPMNSFIPAPAKLPSISGLFHAGSNRNRVNENATAH